MKVFSIGDSIRRKSQEFVLDNLDGEIELSSPPENCKSSGYILEKLDEWLGDDFYDVIHINCGLHDVRFDPEQQGHPVTPIEKYAENLSYIFEALKERCSILVWATSTPIHEKLHNELRSSKRYTDDIIKYNALSVELAKEFGCLVNDLYSKSLQFSSTSESQPDGVHYAHSGNMKIGLLVAEFLNGLKSA